MDVCDEHRDPFNQHFLHDLSPELLTSVSERQYETSKTVWPSLKQLAIKLPKVIQSKNPTRKTVIDQENITYAEIPSEPVRIDTNDLNRFFIKTQISGSVLQSNLIYTGESKLSSFQRELLSVIHEYRDFYFTDRSFSNAEEIRFVYCLHAINHALKTRFKIIHHNAKINDETDIPNEYRDQGLVRPKVLVVVPFKSSAFSIIKMISSILLGEEKQNVVNKKRFYDEFGGGEMSLSQKKSRPEDYEKTFSGNIDDNFKIGITVTKKSLKLYADFYSSDIIVASPLGLRMLIGAEGEKDRDYDFLSSIEVLILDQIEVLLMQNWDHVLHLMNHLNLQPTESHGTNFSRVRSWALNGWTKYYRQNLIFSGHPLIEIAAMVNKKCFNYAGCVRSVNPVVTGTISQVVVSIPQLFYRLSDKSANETVDERFDMFTQKILPQCQDNLMKHVLIYVPSYFDFVRLRNYFKNEAIGFVQICEYSKDRKVAQARDMFFHNEVNYMLYSERFHFFMRRKIRGICNVIFYQLPTFPHFYSEICNVIQEANQNPKTIDTAGKSISAIYSKFDAPQLAAIVSTDRAARILSSDEEVHVFKMDDT